MATASTKHKSRRNVLNSLMVLGRGLGYFWIYLFFLMVWGGLAYLLVDFNFSDGFWGGGLAYLLVEFNFSDGFWEAPTNFGRRAH